MFHELYGLVNLSINNTVASERTIPRSKRGAVIAEATTGLMHVLSGLQNKNDTRSAWAGYQHPDFLKRSENQLRWRLMLHLGLDDKTSNKLIQKVLPQIQSALGEHYKEISMIH